MTLQFNTDYLASTSRFVTDSLLRENPSFCVLTPLDCLEGVLLTVLPEVAPVTDGAVGVPARVVTISLLGFGLCARRGGWTGTSVMVRLDDDIRYLRQIDGPYLLLWRRPGGLTCAPSSEGSHAHS